MSLCKTGLFALCPKEGDDPCALFSVAREVGHGPLSIAVSDIFGWFVPVLLFGVRTL